VLGSVVGSFKLEVLSAPVVLPNDVVLAGELAIVLVVEVPVVVLVVVVLELLVVCPETAEMIPQNIKNTLIAIMH
jgi:hypothetical protein